MYKKVLKNIHKISSLKNQLVEDFYKSEDNPILARRLHYIFSAENPLYPENKKYNMGHSDVVDLLQRKGYKVEEAQGHYGVPERSIIVHNPSKLAVKHLLNLSRDLGQESGLYSTGYDHELHYLAGPNAGKHVKGQGTTIHKRKPDDLYTTTNDGTHFTHLLNFNELHEPSKSLISQNEPLKKSESNRLILAKNENKHPLETAGPDTKLIHYSPVENLSVIDPFHHGVRGIGAEAKRGKPEHPTSFFYLEGQHPPESIVTSGAKSKYVSRLGHFKLYDIGEDSEGIKSHLKSSGKTVNPGIFTRDELDAEIKRRGYHGLYNSGLDDTMKNVMAIYHPVQVEKEMRFHPKDSERVSSEDHHGNEMDLQAAKQFAKENGHHDGRFLHNLARKFQGENG